MQSGLMSGRHSSGLVVLFATLSKHSFGRLDLGRQTSGATMRPAGIFFNGRSQLVVQSTSRHSLSVRAGLLAATCV